ncbi:transmembrane adaptor Erv26-domain-containing protein [Lentinula edodes]|uniref:Transmembrane adaptor Erv26-domain-containing protein n=1 Tax=Lentinula lateritia TaxID=40482 RepID=A0A9W9AYE5_9AGAR|nr:transmembrane adaptor Erv26-domain-containing protein [Lentinula edodes]
MGVLFYLSYVAILVTFAFITLSIASGLLYISELIEEHSQLAKTVGQRTTYIIILFHVTLYFTDALPLKHILFSIFCHMVYLQNFSSTWPVIPLTSFVFLASCLLVIADHFLWFFHFAHLTQDARHQRYYQGRGTITAPSFTEIVTFFGACVWLIPLFIFLSLSANDNAIPLRSAEPSSPSVNKTKFAPKQPRQSLLRSILSKLPGSKFSRTEGLIAPPSPYHSASIPSDDTALRSPSIGGLYQNALSPPPKSPGPRQAQDFFSIKNSSSGSFQLSTPPRRSHSTLRSSNIREGEGAELTPKRIGLGLRRAASSSGGPLGIKEDD